MIKSRIIAADLGLDMKIGDVEYQGDKTKAIFYYIASDRVDFRKLIKILAETFHIRIEMKQIGRPSGSRAYRGYRLVRTQIVLFHVYHELYFRVDVCRPLPGYFPEPAETSRTMR